MLYEYKCYLCDSHVEFVLSVEDRNIMVGADCNVCLDGVLERVISAPLVSIGNTVDSGYNKLPPAFQKYVDISKKSKLVNN